MVKHIRSGSQSGFTLIELSIVFVVIAFFVGSILVAKDMIMLAGTRKSISTVDSLTTATNAFKNKYGCTPGDCSKATTFFSSAAQPEKVRAGNGNGYIDIGDDITEFYGIYANSERSAYFDHLAAAGLIEMKQFDETSNNLVANGSGYLKTKSGRGMFIARRNPALSCNYYDFDTAGNLDVHRMTAAQHFIIMNVEPGYSGGNPDGTISTAVAGAGGPGDPYTRMSSIEAARIDLKIDDGKPTHGNVQMSMKGVFGMYINACDSYNTQLKTRNCVQEPNALTHENYNTYRYSEDPNGQCSLAIGATF